MTLKLRHAHSSPLALVANGPTAGGDHAVTVTSRHGARRLWLVRMHRSKSLEHMSERNATIWRMDLRMSQYCERSRDTLPVRSS